MGNAHSENAVRNKAGGDAVGAVANKNKNKNNKNGSSSPTNKETASSHTMKKSPSLLDMMAQIFQPDDDDEKKEPPEKTLRAPKHLLWGCRTAEEHYAYIDEVCERAAAQANAIDGSHYSAEERLQRLGFCFRLVRDDVDDDDDDSLSDDDERQVLVDNSSMDDHDDDDLGGESYMVPIGVPLEKSLSSVMLSGLDDDDDDDQVDNSNDTSIPLDGYGSSSSNMKNLPRTESSVSLFSLATHYSMGSNSSSNDINEPSTPTSANAILRQEEKKGVSSSSALRLHHMASGQAITSENHETFIAHGRMYDLLAQLCMEYAQNIMMEEGQLQWVSVCEDEDDDDDDDSSNIGALVSATRSSETKRSVLLVVTGKGEVGAGIFSRRLLMTLGVEAATALPFIREANQRSLQVVLLDPNAKGWKRGMEVVKTSLEKLFFGEQQQREEQIYVLAHSMAGSQLVRFLQSKTTASAISPADRDSAKDNDNARDNAAGASSWSFFHRIKAVAFTDSNHNINWTKNNPPLKNFLVGSSCLYIKSHKVHENAKALGERHHDCHFWRHRFGNIRTLWAGTHEHALTNYIARFHIWDHFDSFLDDRLAAEE